MSEKFFLDDEVETINLTNVQKCDIICVFKKGGYIMRMDLDKTVTKQEIEAAVRRILSQWNRCENNFQREVLYRSLMNVHYSEPFDWSLVVQLNVLEAEFQKNNQEPFEVGLTESQEQNGFSTEQDITKRLSYLESRRESHQNDYDDFMKRYENLDAMLSRKEEVKRLDRAVLEDLEDYAEKHFSYNRIGQAIPVHMLLADQIEKYIAFEDSFERRTNESIKFVGEQLDHCRDAVNSLDGFIDDLHIQQFCKNHK